MEVVGYLHLSLPLKADTDQLLVVLSNTSILADGLYHLSSVVPPPKYILLLRATAVMFARAVLKAAVDQVLVEKS